MKRLFTFFFALLSACTFSAYAAIVNGTCGDNLTWTVNTDNKTLVISGTGNMTDYSSSSKAPWDDYENNIKYATIEEGVTSVGNYAFSGFTDLISTTLPNSMTIIGNYAFRNCNRMTSLTIGDNIISIGDKAFYKCMGLTSITIPNTVTSIGNNVFEYCTGLKSITIPNSLTTIGENMFIGCSSLTSITIPNSVISIGRGAFSYCESLTSITIPNSVTSIEASAFSNCTGLTSITIPDNIKHIEMFTFSNCTGLTSITIPNNVTHIESNAFEKCSSLTSVTIGYSVIAINNGAFEDCSGIKEVTVYAPTPPRASYSQLGNASCTLYVPTEYLDVYSNDSWWKSSFGSILAIDTDWNVTFVDWDSTTLATMKVPNGKAATAPANPTRENYTFIGWDKDFSRVIEDMTITALYQINRYRVRFYDWDDTLLKTDSVEYLSAATVPAYPTREGYAFIGWDKDFSSITADLDVYAQYEEGVDKDLTIVFSDQEYNEISVQSVTFHFPLAPQIAGFTFLYWQTITARVDDVITIQAVYESNTPTAAPEVFVNPSNPAQKLIRNGQVYILHKDKMYTISGQVVK